MCAVFLERDELQVERTEGWSVRASHRIMAEPEACAEFELGS